MKRIKKGDNVIVIAGKFKKTQTVVTAVENDSVYLKDVNIMKKAKKGQGFIDVHHPIHASNVALLDPTSKIATRVGFEIQKGKKVRITKKSQSVLS